MGMNLISWKYEAKVYQLSILIIQFNLLNWKVILIKRREVRFPRHSYSQAYKGRYFI
jgi:hypothetical protein